jgi:uncharacterized protein YcfL
MRKLLALSFCMLALAGCKSFYRVTDTDTGKTYLTTSDSFDQRGSNHVATFKDDVTKANVTLNSYEYRKMSEAEYQSDLAARQATLPPSAK